MNIVSGVRDLYTSTGWKPSREVPTGFVRQNLAALAAHQESAIELGGASTQRIDARKDL